MFRKFAIREDGSLAGPFDAWLHTPALGSLLERVGTGLRELTEVPAAAREVSILVVAAAWRAPFEWFAHARMASAAGVPDAVIDAIGRQRTPELDDPVMLVATMWPGNWCMNAAWRMPPLNGQPLSSVNGAWWNWSATSATTR